MPPNAFQGEKWVAPKHFPTPPKFGKGIKRAFAMYFIIIFKNTVQFETLCSHLRSTAAS
jgi:hypothetical protein